MNKEITFVRSNDIRKYARGKHTQLNTGRKVHPKYGLGCTTNVRMVIQYQQSKNERPTINFKAIGLLEVLGLHITVYLSVFRNNTVTRKRMVMVISITCIKNSPEVVKFSQH